MKFFERGAKLLRERRQACVDGLSEVSTRWSFVRSFNGRAKVINQPGLQLYLPSFHLRYQNRIQVSTR